MNKEQMKSTLLDLHRQLESTGNADPELTELLRAVERDIHSLLSKDSSLPFDASQKAGAASRLDDLASRFAAEHPQLTPVLGQVAEALSRMGL